MKKALLLFAITLFLGIKLSAQIGINATNTAPNVSAMLDVASSTKGALLPRMTTVQRTAIPLPALGLTVFDIDTKSYWYFDGTNWVSIANSTNFWSKFEEEDDIFNNNTGNVGIGLSSPTEKLHVANGNVQFGINDTDPFASQNIFLWNATKGALRAGNPLNTEWDLPNLGQGSFATGYGTIASGIASVALNAGNTSTNYFSTSIGFGNTASGQTATAIGLSNVASDPNSVVTGYKNLSNPNEDSYEGSSFVTGKYNEPVYNSLFSVGNGFPEFNPSGPPFITRKNALVVMKNGNIGIGTNDPKTRLHVADSSVVFTSTPAMIQTPPPISGAGTRMMWYADRGAFRTGNVSGGQWDSQNTGTYSFAAGQNSIAGGEISIALGSAAAMGNNSTAIGFNASTYGNHSTSIGLNTTAFGTNSISLGYGTTTNSFGSISLGQYNDPIAGSTQTNSMVPTDPLFVIGNGTDNANRKNAVRINKNGNFGIGNIDPQAPLHVSGTTITTANLARAYFHQNTGSSIQQNTSPSGSIQVRADGYFWANGGGFVATSDARIKNIIGKTNNEQDLDILKKIEIINYTYKDNVNNKAGLQKKIIAQQVKSIYPIAVNIQAGVIPNLFEIAKKVSVTGEASLIETTTPHGFISGDLVKLILESGKEIEEEVSVKNANEFTINEPVTDRVFVYGKKVNDLHTVDYDALTTLNISATQALLKRIEQLEIDNLTLKTNFQTQLNKLEALINAKQETNVVQNLSNSKMNLLD